jgi:hypothetical protein
MLYWASNDQRQDSTSQYYLTRQTKTMASLEAVFLISRNQCFTTTRLAFLSQLSCVKYFFSSHFCSRQAYRLWCPQISEELSEQNPMMKRHVVLMAFPDGAMGMEKMVTERLAIVKTKQKWSG